MNNIIPGNIEESSLKELLKMKKPMLIEIRADWCGGSHIIAPIIAKIENEYNNRVKIVRVNYESHKNFLLEFGVVNVPTVLLMIDGQVLKKINGTISRRNLEILVKELLDTQGKITEK
jgi:thioredoxin 1